MLLFLLAQTPIVLMHGFNDHKDTLIVLKDKIQKAYPETQVVNCEVGNGQVDSILMPIDLQVSLLHKCISEHDFLQDGFFAVGHSQGAYLFRHYIQTYDTTVLRLYSLAGPLGGMFCGRKSKCFGIKFPWFVNNYLEAHAYSETFQKHLGVSNYWRDPFNLEVYEERSTSLALIDNDRDFDFNRKRRFMQVEKYVLFGGPNDGIITPWQSTFFGVFDENTDVDVIEYMDRKEYTDDTFGLRSMVEQGRVEFITTDIGHLEYVLDGEFMDREVIPRLAE